MSHDRLLVGQLVDPARLNILDTQGTYTPVLGATTTDPTLGSGSTAAGNWWRSGHWIEGFARFAFGTSMNAGSGTYTITVPFPPDTTVMGSNGTGGAAHRCAWGRIRDLDTGGNSNNVVGQFRADGGVERLWFSINASNGAVTHSTPIPWTTGDLITIHFGYLADSDDLPTP
jgi:hypothetical protein